MNLNRPVSDGFGFILCMAMLTLCVIVIALCVTIFQITKVLA